MGELSPAFQFYARDFLVSCGAMTPEQVGAYIRLLAHAWDGHGLPNDEAQMMRLAGCSAEEWGRVWPALRGKWEQDGDRLRNARLERERAAQQRRREGAALGGRKGAETKARVKSTSSQLRSQHLASNVVDNLANGNTAFASASVDLKPTTTTSLDARARDGQEPSSSSVDPTAYHPGQIRAGIVGLVGAWNNVAAEGSPFAAVDPGFTSPSLSRALSRHPDIGYWADVFRRATKSDYLTGRDGKHPPMVLVRVVDLAEDIMAGKYDPRPEPKIVAKPKPKEWRPPQPRPFHEVAMEQGLYEPGYVPRRLP